MSLDTLIPYFIFSGFEAFGLVFLNWMLFDFKLRHNPIGFFITTLLLVVFGYVLVITELFKIIPIPFVYILMNFVYFKFFRHYNYLLSLIVPATGVVVYGVIQLAVAMTAVATKFLGINQVQDAFATETYFCQIITTLITLIASYYIKLNHQMFGVNLNNKEQLFVTLTPLCIFFICIFISFYVHMSIENFVTFIILNLLLALTAVVVVLFLKAREAIEYKIFID